MVVGNVDKEASQAEQSNVAIPEKDKGRIKRNEVVVGDFRRRTSVGSPSKKYKLSSDNAMTYQSVCIAEGGIKTSSRSDNVGHSASAGTSELPIRRGSRLNSRSVSKLHYLLL